MNKYYCMPCLYEIQNGDVLEIDKHGNRLCPQCRIPLSIDNPENNDSNHRDYNVGKSDYAKHKIQPWDIWEEYELDPWRADIVKRILRNKEDEDPVLDLEKIKHICDKLIDMEKKKNG